jgi:hypothetical protein
VTIETTHTTYSAAMSSIVGFDLTPHYTGPDAATVRYRWVTDYGTFLTWDAPEYRVMDAGREVVTGNATVYWTYRPVVPGSEPEQVTVSLTVEDSRTGSVRARAQRAFVRTRGGYQTVG